MEDMASRQRSNLFFYDNDITITKSQNTSFVSQAHILSNGYCFAKMFDIPLLRQEGIRFDEKLHIHEDHLFCFEYLTKCKGIRIKCGGGYIYQIGNRCSLSFAIKPTYNLVTTSQRFLAYFRTLFPAYNINEDYRKTRLTDYVGSRILLEQAMLIKRNTLILLPLPTNATSPYGANGEKPSENTIYRPQRKLPY